MLSDFLKKFSEVNALKTMFLGIIVGIFSGLVSVFYRYLILNTDILRNFIYEDFKFYYLIGFILIALVAAMLLKWAPFSGGSGIPQIKAELEDRLEMKPTRVVSSKLIGGSLFNIVGLSLGREGPSIQIGGMVGKFLAEKLSLKKEDVHMLISAGAAAGLSAAFNAPVAGVMFSLEELYKSISEKILLCTIAATTSANAISYALMGKESSFSFKVTEPMSLKYLWIAILIGIATGCVGVIFNKLILKSQDFWNKISDVKIKMIILSLVGAIFGIFAISVTGGGHGLVEEIANGDFTLNTLVILLILKLIYTTFCYGSGVQGGIFLPVLVLGAIVGSSVYNLMDISQIYLVNFIILGMVGILSSVVRAPILSIILILEMTGTFSVMLLVAITSMVAFVVAECLKNPPIYESLYERIVSKLC